MNKNPHKQTKKQEAFSELDVLLKQRRTAQWDPCYEEGMLLYTELGVTTLKSCREGLLNFRRMVQTSKPDSLKKVLIHYMDEFTKKSEEDEKRFAEEEKSANTEEEKEKAMNNQFENNTLKYVWDSYCDILFIIQNNDKLNDTWEGTVFRACDFCFRLKRSTEFKSLCDKVKRRYMQIENNQRYEHRFASLSLSLFLKKEPHAAHTSLFNT